jgi:hypothetical protein
MSEAGRTAKSNPRLRAHIGQTRSLTEWCRMHDTCQSEPAALWGRWPSRPRQKRSTQLSSGRLARPPDDLAIAVAAYVVRVKAHGICSRPSGAARLRRTRGAFRDLQLIAATSIGPKTYPTRELAAPYPPWFFAACALVRLIGVYRRQSRIGEPG